MSDDEGTRTAQAKADDRFDAKNLKQAMAALRAGEAQVEALKDLVVSIARGQSSAEAIRVEFMAAWEQRTCDHYVGSVARDLGTIRTLRRKLDDNEIRRRLPLYFADPDAWLEREGWPLSLFATKIVNRYRQSARAVAAGRGRQTEDADLFHQALETRRKGPRT